MLDLTVLFEVKRSLSVDGGVKMSETHDLLWVGKFCWTKEKKGSKGADAEH